MGTINTAHHLFLLLLLLLILLLILLLLLLLHQTGRIVVPSGTCLYLNLSQWHCFFCILEKFLFLHSWWHCFFLHFWWHCLFFIPGDIDLIFFPGDIGFLAASTHLYKRFCPSVCPSAFFYRGNRPEILWKHHVIWLSSTYLFIHSFIQSINHSYIHSFIHSLMFRLLPFVGNI